MVNNEQFPVLAVSSYGQWPATISSKQQINNCCCTSFSTAALKTSMNEPPEFRLHDAKASMADFHLRRWYGRRLHSAWTPANHV